MGEVPENIATAGHDVASAAAARFKLGAWLGTCYVGLQEEAGTEVKRLLVGAALRSRLQLNAQDELNSLTEPVYPAATSQVTKEAHSAAVPLQRKRRPLRASSSAVVSLSASERNTNPGLNPAAVRRANG